MIPLMTGKLLDEGVKAGSMHHIAAYGLTVVGMAVLALICGGLSGRFGAKASTGFARNLRREMYRNVQKFSFANIDKFSTSGIITRLTTDVTNVQMAFMMVIRIAVRSPIMLICAWVLTLRINPKLALIFLVVIPILGIGLALIMTRAHPIFERVFKRYDHLNNVVQENLLGIRVVKSFVREDHEVEKFGKVSQEIYMDFSKAERILAFNMPLMQICVYACMISVSWIGANLIVGGSMTTGQLTSMFSYIMMMLMSLMMLSMVLTMIIMARASAERITEILNEESDLKNGSQPIEEVKDGSVVFENVSFSYAKDPSKECLKNVNLTVKSGETVGILGGTGTSKTTLVQLIPRLYDATEGASWWAARTSGTTIWTPCGTRWPWCCRRTCCSPAPSRIISAGAKRTPLTRRWSGCASWPRRTPLSRSSPTSTTPISSRAAPTSPAGRSSGFASPGPC